MDEDSKYLRWLIDESLADSLEWLVQSLRNSDNSGDDIMTGMEALIAKLRTYD